MMALALGYYLGGKLADRRPQLNLLLKLILVAGLIFLLIPWVAGPLSILVTFGVTTIDSISIAIFIGSLLITLLLFAFPLVLLGMVSPFIIKLFSLQNKEIGQVAGSVFAISTIGSIIGTFLPTLWLIAFFGTKVTITIFAAILIILAVAGLANKKRFLFLLVLLILPVWGANWLPTKIDAGLLHEDESVYQYLQIQYHNGKYLLVFNEGGGVQSVYEPGNVLTGMYHDYFTVLPYLIPRDRSQVLILGLAGGTISRQLNYFFADRVKIDGVEIDEKVIEAAEQYFALQNDSLTVHNHDGRTFLQQTPDQYDIIIIDAYQKQMYIPWTMTTQEFWQETNAKLTDQGLVAINVNAAAPDSPLLQAIVNSMASVFSYTYLAKAGDEDSWNYMLVASRDKLPWQSLTTVTERSGIKGIAGELSQNMQRFEYNPTQMVLTDDKAPIEFMMDKMVVDYYLDQE